MATTHRTPRDIIMIRDLSDEGLVDHYVGLKALAYNGAALKSTRLGGILRQLDITIAIARKRGIPLPAAWGPGFEASEWLKSQRVTQ